MALPVKYPTAGLTAPKPTPYKAPTSNLQMPQGFSQQALPIFQAGSANAQKAQQLAAARPVQQASTPGLSQVIRGPAYNPTDSSQTRGMTGTTPSWAYTGPNPTGVTQAPKPVAATMPTRPTGASETRTPQMPTGFAGPALGTTQPPAAGGPTPDYTKSNAGGVEYMNDNGADGPKQTHSSVTGPGALQKGVVNAGSKQGTDQWGRTFYYNEAPGGGNNSQPVAGVSNHATVLRQVTNADGTPYIGQDGKPVIYDTGVAAYQPVAPKPAAPVAPPVAVGRPTQAGQPVSTPVIQQPAPPPPPRTREQGIEDEQGKWLG